MNQRTAMLMGAIAIVVAIIILLIVAAWGFGANATGNGTAPANGSFLHPQVMREAREGYVLAELY